MDIDLLLGILSSGATGVVTYFFTRKQREADVTSKKIDNVNKTLDVYDRAFDDIRAENKEKAKEIYELTKQLSAVNLKVASLMRFSCVNMTCTKRLTDLRILDLSEKDVKKLNEEELKKE